MSLSNANHFAVLCLLTFQLAPFTLRRANNIVHFLFTQDKIKIFKSKLKQMKHFNRITCHELGENWFVRCADLSKKKKNISPHKPLTKRANKPIQLKNGNENKQTKKIKQNKK